MDTPEPTQENIEQLESLHDAVREAERVWILLHDGPDPDAMACGLVMQTVLEEKFGINAGITYGGIMSRPDNKAMPDLLGIAIHHIATVEVNEDDRFICMDTQPAFSNNSLPEKAQVVGLVDHHPEESAAVFDHVDIRPGMGSATTIAVEYLCAAELPLTSQLATAITYAIISETEDLGRKVSYQDLRVYIWALQKADHVLIGRLRHPRVERRFFQTLAASLNAAYMCDHAVVCHLQNVHAADELPRIADILNPLEGNSWVFCTGEKTNEMILTLRSSDVDANAERVMNEILAGRGGGGGHGMVAGGQVELEDDEDTAELRQQFTRRFLEAVGLDPDAELEPLLNPSAEEMIPQE